MYQLIAVAFVPEVDFPYGVQRNLAGVKIPDLECYPSYSPRIVQEVVSPI